MGIYTRWVTEKTELFPGNTRETSQGALLLGALLIVVFSRGVLHLLVGDQAEEFLFLPNLAWTWAELLLPVIVLCKIGVPRR